MVCASCGHESVVAFGFCTGCGVPAAEQQAIPLARRTRERLAALRG
jgi:hypothetical protein